MIINQTQRVPYRKVAVYQAAGGHSVKSSVYQPKHKYALCMSNIGCQHQH